MALYDKYYQDENYFGNSYPKFISFFKNRCDRGTVLDLGCDQGRDSLALAKLGYDVTGVDISKVGIEQMREEANRLKLNVKGEIADIYDYSEISNFDTVILDSMLHFYPKDKAKETDLYIKILDEMKIGGLFCNLMIQSKKNENYVKSLVQNNPHEFSVIFNSHTKYLEGNCEYHMFVIKKIR